MSAHGPREEFIEQAWQEIAVELRLNSKPLSWFKQWFEQKMVTACAVLCAEEKDKHMRTQEWLDKFMGEAAAANLEIARVVQQCGELSSKVSALQREARLAK